MIEVLNFFT